MNHHTIFKSLLITLVVFAFNFLSNAQTTGTNQQKSDSTIQPNKHAPIFEVVEQMPQYPGGDAALMKFISTNLKYPVIAQENGTQGNVIVRFIVNTLGEVENAKVIRSVSPECDNEALRVVRLTKNWVPGKQNGTLVNVYYTFPIKYKLIDSSKPTESHKKPLVILDGKLLPKGTDLNSISKDSIQSVDIIKPGNKSKFDELLMSSGSDTSNGVIVITTKWFARTKTTTKNTETVAADSSKVYDVIEQMPQFPGGERALMNFIGSNLHYPVEAQKSGIQGMVIIRFVVSKTGKVCNVDVLRSVFPALDNEAVRVVKSLPEWIPGEQKGKKVNVYYTLPIKFKLT